MADRVIETQLRFINDKQATNQVLRDNARIDDSLKDIDGSAARVENAYSDMEDAARRAAKAQREANEATIKAAKEQSELVGDVASRTSQLSGAVSGLGAIGGQRLLIAADILDAVEAAQLLRAEFPAMISQMIAARSQLLLLGGVGGALAIGAIAINKYNEAQQHSKQILEDVRQAVTEYINKLTDLNTFFTDATQRDVQERLDQRQRELEGVQRTRQQLENEIAKQIEIQRKAIEDGKLTGAETVAFAEAGFIIKRLTEQISPLNEQIVGLEGEIKALTTGLVPSGEGITELGDAVFNLGSFGRVATNAMEDLVDQLSPVQAEIDNYNAILAKQAEDELEAARALWDLNEATESLAGIPYDAIQKGAQAIANAEAERVKVVEEAEQQILDVQAETAKKRADLIASTERDLVELSADFAQERADAERDYYETIGEITRDYNADRLKDLQDFQRDERRRLEDHRDAMLDAAGRLDAVALLNEQRNFEKEDKRAKEDFKTEQKRRDKEFKQRLKDEEQAFKKERQQAERAYRERERDLRDSLNRQLSDLRTAQNREIADIRAHQAERIATIDNSLETELRKLTGFTQEENTIRDTHYVQMLDALQTFVDEANATVAGLGGGGAVGSSIIPDTPGAVGQFPLSSGLRAPGGLASPFASPMAMLPPVSRSVSRSVTNAPHIEANFVLPDFISPGMARNFARIVIDTLQAELIA